MHELEGYKMDRERVSYKDLVELIHRYIAVVNENIKETNQNVKETNNKLDNLHSKVESILIQTTKTNGRVNTLEAWEKECDRVINELRAENKLQDKQIAVTNKDLAMISVKVAGILTVIGFLIYLTTGFVV
jgi:chromosome segregation ATPase